VLERQHAALEAQRASLINPATLVPEARRLGMVRPGEQTYVITGLPSN
jgi:cell division protein FtsB